METDFRADDSRQETELNGTWQFATDPDDDGRDEGWYEPDSAWPDRTRSVEVPHAWQELEEFRGYTGTAWYRRTIALDAPDDDRFRRRLRFDAVDYETTVWVNGDRVGANRGGYLPFETDVTDALVDGENEVVVEVVDPDDLSELPHGKQGEPWYQRVSGIWQDVTLEAVPPVRVEGIRVTPDLETDTAHVELDVDGLDDLSGSAGSNGGSTVVAHVVVTRDDRTVAAESTAIDGDGASGTEAVSIPIPDADYWTPETPALYDVRVDLEREGAVVDRHEDYFGMRSVEARDGQVYLNGEPYVLRGALEQGYYPETLYRPFDEDCFEREVRTATELGFNLLRKHIKPAHPDFLECADRLGILVWEEPANPTVHTDRSRRAVFEQLEGMIERDYNRPSVVIWSIYNEEWGIGNPQGLDVETSLWEDEGKQRYLADCYESTRERDPTRLVCDNSGWAHVATDVNDYHRYFVSPDRADAWEADLDRMADRPEDNYAAAETDPDDAPIIVSEFGTWGLCDAPAIEESYGERPPWFDYEFLEQGLKRPDGYRERFEESTLTEAFDEFEALAEAWQWREFRSNKDVIERMRARDDVAGYVITEFSDIEWEFNGILDYRREQKVFHDEFARVNAPVAVQLECESRTVWDDGTIAADAVVVNDTDERLEAELSWTAAGESGQRTVAVDPVSTVRVEDLIAVDAPTVDAVGTEAITLAFGDATTEEPVTIGPRADSSSPVLGRESGADEPIYAEDEALRDALEERGTSVVDQLDDTVAAAVVTETRHAVLEYARDGGDVVLLADRDGSVADGDVFDYRDLPEDESWNLVASLLYTNDERLEPPLGSVPGWELDGRYPYTVASVTEGDDVSVGYVEGWLANPSAAVATRQYGDGAVRVCTLRVIDGYGSCPVATALVDELVAMSLEESARLDTSPRDTAR
ncbi:glycoside hydrolase family 2 protein [Natronorubrum texcoconense]|uniref:Glycosyl hydrolases family 2 n=1 Tax=Natronorubrum texcoconense TaxID=1095776 RepID=A0A1G9CRD6_9EURY|nr:sugar-binding domain-containing protein [Natronorubrum texcoconense]SDK54169.1 Glycosyl hydrolases family 2 [Natronorubrum texcoconense]